jgi:hypothetical protein
LFQFQFLFLLTAVAANAVVQERAVVCHVVCDPADSFHHTSASSTLYVHVQSRVQSYHPAGKGPDASTYVLFCDFIPFDCAGITFGRYLLTVKSNVAIIFY